MFSSSLTLVRSSAEAFVSVWVVAVAVRVRGLNQSAGSRFKETVGDIL
jgi:hypothetical protein